MTRDQIVELFERRLKATNEHDVESVADLYAPDAVVESPLGAAMGTMAVLVASTLLLTLDAADSIAAYLPTRYWLAFVDLFRDPIHWRDVVRGSLLQGAYVLVFLGAGWANFATKDIKQ